MKPNETLKGSVCGWVWVGVGGWVWVGGGLHMCVPFLVHGHGVSALIHNGILRGTPGVPQL